MQLDVQWFVSTLVDNGILSLDDALAFHDSLGGDPDVLAYAQGLLDQYGANMSETDAQNMAAQFQQVIEYARQQAQTGTVPPVFDTGEELPESAPEPARPAPAGEPAILKKIREISGMSDDEVKQFMRDLLTQLREFGASDLHISSNAPLFVRRNLELIRFEEDWRIPDADCERLNFALLSEAQIEQFKKDLDMNFALEINGARFRAALMYHKDGMSGAYRMVPEKARTLEDLGFLPDDAHTLARLLDYHNGLILVTGPLGSGKTTTLASMVDIANNKREDHIITVEDPIEIVIPSKKCQVTQRQIGRCTESYRTALKGALREDPDIIVIGEMHDLETIENAITASETGHLVIGTLHTCDAANTLNRVLDVFPPSQQAQIRAMTAGSLRGIICQKLVPRAGGGLTIIYEILINTLAVSNTISEGKIFQLKASMQIGSKSGMCTIDQNIYAKYKHGDITLETAMANLKDKSIIDMIKREIATEEAKKFAAARKKK